MPGYVNSMQAHGGGDGPEAVTAALFEALALPWRPNATKICASKSVLWRKICSKQHGTAWAKKTNTLSLEVQKKKKHILDDSGVFFSRSGLSGVLIADAPPHGLEPSGDGFPNGDPDGRDPLDILRDMTVHGITCYTVGCLV